MGEEEMNLEKIKALAEKGIGNAETLLYKDGFLSSMILAGSGERVTPALVKTGTGVEKEDAMELMRSLAETSDYIIFLMDGYTLSVKPEDVAGLPASIKDHPDASEAIWLFLFLKGKTFMRRVLYRKEGDGYNFCDLGWEEPKSLKDCMFTNPYSK